MTSMTTPTNLKAGELRIGNWVLNSHNGEPCQVTSIDISDIENGIKTRQDIPLNRRYSGEVWYEDLRNTLH